MTTELQIQEALQDTVQALESFAADSVTINDWSILDGPMQNAPYVIITNSDEFDAVQDTQTGETLWVVRMWLVSALANTDWKTAMDDFRDYREELIASIRDEDRSAGGLAGVNIRRVRSEGPVGYIYPLGIDPEFQPDATPDFIAQYIAAEVELF